MRRFVVILALCSFAGAQEIKRPTAESDPGASTLYGCSGSNQASSSMPNAYDASGLTTSSIQTVSTSSSTARYKNRLFTTWQTTGNTYSALTLNVSSASNGATYIGAACIKYSTDNGVTWTSVKCDSGTGWSQQTTSVSISAATDLSKLKVSACVQSKGDGVSETEDVTIWDIWTVGTTTAAAAGTGNGSGTASRRLLFVF